MPAFAGVSCYRKTTLNTGWQLASVAPGAANDPSQLDTLQVTWQAATVPGTVATALRSAGRWQLGSRDNLDAEDWWYRCQFEATPPAPGSRVVLHMEGLATIADVWLNGAHVLRSDNMFLAHALDITELVRPSNLLLIRFHSLQALLDVRRSRPRWRTRLVEHQQLRWFRTTLLGRMPGWSPRVACVGPWRPAWVEERNSLVFSEADLRSRLEGRTGIVEASLRIAALNDERVHSATLVVGGQSTALRCQPSGAGWTRVNGEARLDDVAIWWPHTHGAQPLYEVKVLLRLGAAEIRVDWGKLGFRTIELAEAGFGLVVNGVPIFCRGACWTTLDIAALAGSQDSYATALHAARAAGMNMLRVSGTMVYEADAFYDLCDELGVMVWQDFMFANMDYPAFEDDFVGSVRAEAIQLLVRLQARPCLAVLCGNSEVEQQAAFLGLPRGSWSSRLFEEVLPRACQVLRPDIAYIASSPSGGSLPFRVDTGAAHYYGVGAYLRPLDDARRAQVSFASECLAFANVPEDATLELVFGDEPPSTQHPAWKARVPRDVGAAWDFEDVRDHYLKQLFRLDPLRLRYADMPRYLALSRVTTGELMAAVFAEWRRPASTCQGGLVWFFQDLWPGAGWGVIDSTGRPKPAYYFLKRHLGPVGLFASDEGLNGLCLHALNDTASDIRASLQLSLYRDGNVTVGRGTRKLAVPARSAAVVDAEDILGNFLDTTYTYRFGPPGYDLAVAVLTDAVTGAVIADAFYFPLGLPSARETDVGLAAVAHKLEPNVYKLTLRTERFAQSVLVDAPEFVSDDNYFHLEPGRERTVVLRSIVPGRELSGSVRALNAYAQAAIREPVVSSSAVV